MTPALDILLVEDDDGDVLLIRESLDQAGFKANIHVADDGEAALDFLFRRAPFDDAPTPQMVLLDLNLPKINGLEVLREMRATPELAAIPVVVLTTSKADRDIARSYELGANCFLSKPRNFDEFAAIGDVVDHFWRGWCAARSPETPPCRDWPSIA